MKLQHHYMLGKMLMEYFDIGCQHRSASESISKCMNFDIDICILQTQAPLLNIIVIIVPYIEALRYRSLKLQYGIALDLNIAPEIEALRYRS